MFVEKSEIKCVSYNNYFEEVIKGCLLPKCVVQVYDDLLYTFVDTDYD